MNLSLNTLLKYDIDANDGDIGYIKDILFDDQQWTIRYLSVDTKRWMPLSKKVLISPISVSIFDSDNKKLTLSLTKQNVLDSPNIEAYKPVSLQFKKSIDQVDQENKTPQEDSNLRSMDELKHYDVVETDGMKGHVRDFVFDTDTWTIKYLVIDTRNWLPKSRKALLPPQYLEEVSWKDQAVFCQLKVEQIKQIPTYDETLLNDAAYLSAVHAAFN